MSAHLTPDDDFTLRLGRDLVVLSHKWRRALSRRIAVLGVSDAQWSILDSLRRTGDGVHQQVIANRLGLDRSAMVRVFTDMEHLGLIRREAPRRDARQKMVYLTETGHDLALQIYGIIRSFEAPLQEGIAAEDLATFHRLLMTFSTRIDPEEKA